MNNLQNYSLLFVAGGYSIGIIIAEISWKIREWKIDRDNKRAMKRLGLTGQERYTGWNNGLCLNN